MEAGYLHFNKLMPEHTRCIARLRESADLSARTDWESG